MSVTSLAATFEKENVDPHHNWKITFSNEVDHSTVTSSNIYVVEGTKRLEWVTLAISANNKAVRIVAPKDGYQPGRTYKLYVSDHIKSNRNESLQKSTTLQFTIAQKNKKPTVVKVISNHVEKSGQTVTFNLLDYFADDDALTFSASVGTIQQNNWTYASSVATTSKVTITATDSYGEAITHMEGTCLK